MQGKSWKLAKPFYGPYRILSLTPTNAEIRLVDKPNDPSIFVSLSRLRPCCSELSDVSWSGAVKRCRRKKVSKPVETPVEPGTSSDPAVVSNPNRRVTRSMTCKNRHV